MQDYTLDFAGLLLYDSVVFVLTLYKTASMQKIRAGRLFYVMLRDGM